MRKINLRATVKHLLRAILIGSLSAITCMNMAHAAQKNYFNDNETLSVNLSDSNINKLFIEGDSVIDLHAPKHYLVSSVDDEGAVYIQLVAKKPFTFYISTEQKHHVGVIANPVTSQGATVEFIPKTASPLAKLWEDKKNSQTRMVDLMKAMMQGVRPSGYGLQKSTQEPITLLDKGTVKPVTHYQGARFEGEIYTFCNDSREIVHFKESDFADDKRRAIALSAYQVKPSQIITIYTVSRRAV